MSFGVLAAAAGAPATEPDRAPRSIGTPPRPGRGRGAERTRRAGSARLRGGIEHVGTAAGLARRRRAGAALQQSHLLLKLLVAILQFLDLPGHLAELVLQPVDPGDQAVTLAGLLRLVARAHLPWRLE
ncbi:hypothetical protein ACFSKM_04415 [Ancylobacter dichloromethanicus]